MNAVLTPDFARHRNEILRELRNGRFERTPNGLLFPRMRAEAAGVFEHWMNGQDHRVDPNVFLLTGLDTFFTAGITAGTYYIALFSGNVAPTSALTAATFPATQTEFTNYTESTRQQWVKNSYTNTQSLSNSASKAVFTFDTGGGTVWGVFLTSASAKSATTGTGIACSQFSAARVGLATDTLTIQYTLSLTTT